MVENENAADIHFSIEALVAEFVLLRKFACKIFSKIAFQPLKFPFVLLRPK